jgi:hypothetical protein
MERLLRRNIKTQKLTKRSKMTNPSFSTNCISKDASIQDTAVGSIKPLNVLPTVQPTTAQDNNAFKQAVLPLNPFLFNKGYVPCMPSISQASFRFVCKYVNIIYDYLKIYNRSRHHATAAR